MSSRVRKEARSEQDSTWMWSNQDVKLDWRKKNNKSSSHGSKKTAWRQQDFTSFFDITVVAMFTQRTEAQTDFSLAYLGEPILYS